MIKPLQGITVLDFSLFLAGPLSALRLADLGARVIKIERPGTGELGRQLYINNLKLDDDSMLFHSINRNKQSFAADLKDPVQLARVKKLVAKADVMIQNFRPGVMKRLGLDYESCRALNPKLVYGSITGYGTVGPWSEKPGQDLLAQSVSGLLWLTGDGDSPPTPMGLSVADMFAGHFMTQGILACLVRRGTTGQGGHVETSLVEALLDFQFEVLTTYLNDGKIPQRSAFGNANAYLGAPYGVYKTADGWLAIAMNPLAKLADLLNVPDLKNYTAAETFAKRDEIKHILAARLAKDSTEALLAILDPADIWCAEVHDWPKLVQHEAFKALQMVQSVTRSTGSKFTTTRCPLRIDEQRLTAEKGSPNVGEDTETIAREFNL